MFYFVILEGVFKIGGYAKGLARAGRRKAKLTQGHRSDAMDFDKLEAPRFSMNLRLTT
jgi:hypothetical protein